jgi:hypothetical protein
MNALPSERERNSLAAWASQEDLQLSDSLAFRVIAAAVGI